MDECKPLPLTPSPSSGSGSLRGCDGIDGSATLGWNAPTNPISVILPRSRFTAECDTTGLSYSFALAFTCCYGQVNNQV
jgi:hypothetical protein